MYTYLTFAITNHLNIPTFYLILNPQFYFQMSMSVKACKFLLRNFAKNFALCWGLLTSFLKWQKTLAFYSGKEFEASMFKSTYNQTSSDLSITSSCMIIIEIESGIKKNLCFSSMKWIFLARNLNSRHILFGGYIMYLCKNMSGTYLYFKFFSSWLLSTST